MRRFWLPVSGVIALGIGVTVAAQPPQGDEGLPPEGPRPEEGRRSGEQDGPRGGERDPGPSGRPMGNPIVAAIDTDKNGELSAEEIQAAAAALLTLDRNSDGKLTQDELRPQGGPGNGPQGPGGPGKFGPPGGPDGFRPPGQGEDAFGPPQGPPGEFGPDGGPDQNGPGFGRPLDGPPGQRAMGRAVGNEGPNPERMVEHAMQYDADGDGKLSREELLKFATEMTSRPMQGMGRGRGANQGSFGGPGGPGGPGFGPPGGQGGPGAGGPPGNQGPRGQGGRNGSRPNQGDGEPERPRRPDAE